MSTTFATMAGPVVLRGGSFAKGKTTVGLAYELDNPDSDTATVRLQYRTRVGSVLGEWNIVTPKTTTGESIEFNLAGLTPDTLYQMWATTAADFDDDALIYKIEFRTLDSPKVTAAEPSGVTADSAKVTATLFNPDGENQEVFLRYRSLSTEDYETPTPPSQTTTGTSVVFSLAGLTLGTQYLVQVSLDGNFVTGVRQRAFTTLDVPDEPTSVRVSADDGSLTVTWGLPDGDGGSPVTGYVVHWKVLGGEYSASNRIQVSATAVRDVMIPGLNNHTTYVVRVWAINAVGPGGWSGETVGTPNTGPDVDSVSATLIRHESARVKVKTRYVNSSSRPVHVRFKPVDEMTWVRKTGFVSSFTQEIAIFLTGLTPDTLYELQASLDGTFTVGVQQGTDFRTVLQGMADPPTAPQVNVIHGDEKLNVNWSVRNDGGADVTGITLAWWSENAQILELQLSGSHRFYVIRDLQNGTTYDVRVIATNSAGDSPLTLKSGTPSTVPGSEVTGLVASGCNGAISLSWQSPSDDGGSPITGNRVQWKSGFDTYHAVRQAFVTRSLSYTLGSLMDGTEYTVRVLGVNANGGARDANATPLWSREVKTTPLSGVCIAKLTFGNILSDNAPIIVEVPSAEEGTQVNIRHRSLIDSARWSDVQSQTLPKSETIATFDIRGLKSTNFYEAEAWLGSQRPTENRVARAVFITGSVPKGATFTGGGGSQVGRILRIEPAITSVRVNAGDEVLLSVAIYGRQGLHDNGLADKSPGDGRPSFDWFSDGGGSFAEANMRSEWRNGLADDREVRFTAPGHTGSFTVTASLDDSSDCTSALDGEDVEDRTERCTAKIEITVRRSVAAPTITRAPVNPRGVVPETLTDSEGVAYAVFTPVEGGSFAGEGYSLVAGPSVVADGEYIGVSMLRGESASNIGQTHHRYTLGGDYFV